MKNKTLKNARLKLFPDMVQGSDPWGEWRLTGIGASEGHDACSLSKALFDKFCKAIGSSDLSHLPAIIQGNEREDLARPEIEIEVMNEVIPMCASRGFLNASADGVEMVGGKVAAGHEIKSPAVKAHEEHLKGIIGHQKFHQLQQSMFVYGLKEWSFWSYCPEHETPLHEIVVKRDDDYIENKIIKFSEIFWNRVVNREWPDAETSGVELAAQIANGETAPAMIASEGVPEELNTRTNDLIVALGKFEKVEDAETASQLTDLLGSSKQLLKSLEEKRKEIVDPHFAYKKKVDGKFKLVSSQIETADKAARAPLLAYMNEVERKQREIERIERERLQKIEDDARIEREQIEAEAAEAGEEASVETIEQAPVHAQVVEKPVSQTRGSFSSSGTSKKLVFEVVDMSKIPAEYLVLNMVAINAEIKAQKAKFPDKMPEIEGGVVKQENTLRIR